MPFKVGDRITAPHSIAGLACEIVEVRATGYTWRYVPRQGDAQLIAALGTQVTYRSENSSDPFFARGWTIVQ